MSSVPRHPEPESLAAFAEGQLTGETRDAVIAHLDHCEECMNDVSLVMPSVGAEAEKRRFGRPVWLIAIAAAVILAIALPLMRRTFWGSPLDKLVALAPRSARLVQPPLTGGLPRARYHRP